MYKSVVIAAALFNEGATTRAALARAKTLLEEGGKVTLVHVIDEVPGYVAASIPQAHIKERRKDVEDQLDQLVKDEGSGVDVDVVVREGQPAAAILSTADDVGADLVMIASHKPGLSDYFIGSTAARVVRHAPMSVLVTR